MAVGICRLYSTAYLERKRERGSVLITLEKKTPNFLYLRGKIKKYAPLLDSGSTHVYHQMNEPKATRSKI